jgi:hypothetical protein
VRGFLFRALALCAAVLVRPELADEGWLAGRFAACDTVACMAGFFAEAGVFVEWAVPTLFAAV